MLDCKKRDGTYIYRYASESIFRDTAVILPHGV